MCFLMSKQRPKGGFSRGGQIQSYEPALLSSPRTQAARRQELLILCFDLSQSGTKQFLKNACWLVKSAGSRQKNLPRRLGDGVHSQGAASLRQETPECEAAHRRAYARHCDDKSYRRRN